MSAMPQQQQSFAPGVQPALDEQPMQIGPNLATDPKFCEKVLDFCWRNYVYPQVLQQQRLWPIWKRIDDAFRVKGDSYDLDISATDPSFVSKVPDRKGFGGLTDSNDGYSSRVYPATLHKQIVTKTDMHMSIAWGDGLPVRADKPESCWEDPLYNPVTQSVEAFNAELRRCSDKVMLKKKDRKGRGSFCKYGHAWVAVDFKYSLESKAFSYPVPPNPQLAQQMVMQMSQRFGSMPQASMGMFGQVATWHQTTIKDMETGFQPLRVDDVFVDQTLPADDLDCQQCPCVRIRTDSTAIMGNDYDPVENPFGYVNVQLALKKGQPQWSTGPSDTIFQQELQKKWGLSMFGIIRPKNAIKQRWVLYPLMGVYQDPKTGELMIDNNDGITCPQCDGKGTLGAGLLDQHGMAMPSPQCPMCDGTGTYFVPRQRFVVECYGNLEYQNSLAVCLRIQPIPTPNGKVPLLFTANLTEDTAGAIPLCKAEASMKSVDQEATSFNQWFNSKNKQIDPSWLVPVDGFDSRQDLGQHGKNFPTDEPDRFKSLGPSYDPTQNMMEFMARQQNETMAINGMSDQLLGIVSSGRRPATELQNAFDASKMPITIEIDQYGEDILKGWAQWHLDNIKAFVPREQIYQLTGREEFGPMALKASVADEFMKRQAAIGNFQYMMQALGPIPGVNLQPVVTALWRMMKLPGNPDDVMPDGGFKKAREDGMHIATQILGSGQFMPATPSDPHQIYIGVFEGAMKDPYWLKNAPETMPLLQQRLMQQMQLLQMQQEQQMMMQQHMLAQAHMGASLGQHFKPRQGGQTGTTGNQPPMSNQAPSTSGGANQQLMGAAQ